MKNPIRIGVIGAGNVGTAIGLSFRKKGHEVWFYDVCDEKATPFGYKSLKDLVSGSQVIFECVPTGALPDGRCDLSILEQVVREVSSYCIPKQIFVQMSTCIPGTARKMSRLLDCYYVVNPSNLRMATRFQDALNPEKIILGLINGECEAIMREVYWWVNSSDIFVGSFEFAETTKYADNCMQVTLIIFWNVIKHFMEEIGCSAELEKVIYAVENSAALSTCGRYPGGAYGGPCFPKDILALNRISTDIGGNAQLLKWFTEALHRINEVLKEKGIIEIASKDLWTIKGGKIVMLKGVNHNESSQ